MPLMMKPNFDTYECDMVFGKRPPPPEADEASRQPCLPGCPSARAAGRADTPCHKLQS